MEMNAAMQLLSQLGVFKAAMTPKHQFRYSTPPRASRITEQKQKARKSNVSMDMYRYSLRAGVVPLKRKHPFSAR
jgi:hypothetical protein